MMFNEIEHVYNGDVHNDDDIPPAAQQGPPAWRVPPFSVQSSLPHCLLPGTLFIIMITMMLMIAMIIISDMKMLLINFDDVHFEASVKICSRSPSHFILNFNSTNNTRYWMCSAIFV